MKAIVINCFDTYQHRADMLTQALYQEGFEVLQIRSDFSHRRKESCRSEANGVLWVPTKPYQKNLSIGRLRSHRMFSNDCAAVLRTYSRQADLVWALVPPNSLVKALGKGRPAVQAKLVFDLMDLWPESFPLGCVQKLPPMRYWSGLRDRWLSQGDFVVTECELFQSKLRRCIPPERMRRIYDARPDRGIPVPYRLPKDYFSLCYLGSMNHIMDLDAVRQVIIRLKGLRPVALHLIGGGERKTELVDVARQAGADVLDHGEIYDWKEKQAVFACCHAGLNLMRSNVSVGLTMKSVDYLEAGLPIINNIAGDTWDAIEQYRFGFNCTGEWMKKFSAADWDACRRNARAFFEAQLSEQNFRAGVHAVLEDLTLISQGKKSN